MGNHTHTDVNALPASPKGARPSARRPSAEEYDLAIGTYKALWHASGLSARHIKVWCLLVQQPDLGVGGIAAMLEVDRRTVGRAIKRLVDAGFVQRIDQGHDPQTGNFEIVEHVVHASYKPGSEPDPLH